MGRHLSRGELHGAVRGVKDSGLGRENGTEAIEANLETKTVWVNTGAPSGNPFVLH